MKLFFIFLRFLPPNKLVTANEKNKIQAKNIKTFSGPMGMGLSKSFEIEGKKICLYNTVNGQEKIILNDYSKDCPRNLEK